MSKASSGVGVSSSPRNHLLGEFLQSNVKIKGIAALCKAHAQISVLALVLHPDHKVTVRVESQKQSVKTIESNQDSPTRQLTG